jgi:hypothetical protein
LRTANTTASATGAQTIKTNASTAQSCALGTDGKCSLCQRTGFPILAVRYAVEPTFLVGRPANVLVGDNTLEQFADKPVPGHKYTLRTLRKGYVHVWLGSPGLWQLYAVTSAGYLRRMTNPDDPDNKTERELTPACMRDGHNIPASFVNIPPGYKKAWIAFSETVWSPSVRKAVQRAPAKRMQELDIEALSVAPDAQKHAFELTSNAAKLTALVDEYAADAGQFLTRVRYHPTDPLTGKTRAEKWEGAFGLHDRSGQLGAIGKFAVDYSAEVLRKHKKVRKVPVFALHDPVGILKEVNHTRLKFTEFKQNYCEAVMRPLIVAQSIDGLQKIISESALKKRIDEEALKGIPDVQTVYIPSGEYAPPASYTTTRAERAQSDANAIWRKLEARLKPGAKKAFQDTYAKNIKEFDRWITYGDQSWAKWADAPEWMTWFADYDMAQIDKRAELLQNKAACLAGGVVDVASAGVWKKWLVATPFDDKNPLYRTLFGDRKEILEFLAPSEQDGVYKVNKSDKLYDTVKGLTASEEAEHGIREATQLTKAAAAEVSLAMAGAVSALGREVGTKAGNTALRAQQAALLLYQRVEATFLRVQMTVGEYQRMLGEVAFKGVNTLDRAAQGMVKDGERYVKSVVIGGIMSINNAKARNTLIEVVIWTLDKASEVNARLQALAKTANQQLGTTARSVQASANRAIGSAQGELDNMLRQVRLAGINVSHDAARLMGTAEGRVMLKASQLREFAKDMTARSLRVAGGSGEILLAAGAVFFQAWAARDGVKEVNDKLGALSSEAQLGVLSAAVGITGASVELLGASMKALGKEVAGKVLIKLGGAIAAVASIVDSVQAAMSAKRTYDKGDRDASYRYVAASVFFLAGGVIGAYAAAIGASSLLGPLGIALALIAVGVVLLWAAINAEDTIAEIWMDRCYFGKGERTEGKWSDAQSSDELKYLNAIVVGLGAQVGFDDNFLGISEVFTGYDTVRVKVTMGGYEPSRSAYEWTLHVHHKDGRKFAVTGGRGGLAPIIPQLKAWDGKPPTEKTDSWFKNYKRSASVENGALIVEDSVEVTTAFFQKVSVDAKYWVDKSDNQALAQVQLEESD